MSADGKALADWINQEVGTTAAIRRTCNAMCRAATTYRRYGEDQCNGHPANANPAIPIDIVTALQEQWEQRVDRGQRRIEARMRSLLQDLPEPDDGRWVIHLEADPRGASSIVAPSGRTFYIG